MARYGDRFSPLFWDLSDERNWVYNLGSHQHMIPHFVPYGSGLGRAIRGYYLARAYRHEIYLSCK